MIRGEWQQIPAAEWHRRLAATRKIAARGLAAQGLTIDQPEFDVSGLVLEGEVGPLLEPGLAIERKHVAALVAKAEALMGDKTGDFDKAMYELLMSVAETSFRFGLIAGCHLTWPIVESMEAPYAPPRTKGGKAR